MLDFKHIYSINKSFHNTNNEAEARKVGGRARGIMAKNAGYDDALN